MKTKKKNQLKIQELIPVIAFFVILLVFFFWSYNPRKGAFMLDPAVIVEQAMQMIVVAGGAIFVVAMGCIDMSVGVNLALSGVIGTWAAYAIGSGWLMIPVAMIIGAVVGIFNGVMVSQFKVPSFMQTIAMLIGVRGLVNYIQTKTSTQVLPSELTFMNIFGVKLAFFIVILVILAYVFEFTRFGRYCRAIGENETAARFVGVPIKKVKICAFGLSGLMAGVGSIFSVVTVGSTSMQMGTFLEMKVVMAIFLGGVLVTGGASAKFYKILLGSLSIAIIIHGLAVIGYSDVYISQIVEGLLLLLVLFLSIFLGERSGKKGPGDQAIEKIAQKAGQK